MENSVHSYTGQTFEQLQFEWGNSSCGNSPERFIYDFLKTEINRLEQTLLLIVGQR